MSHPNAIGYLKLEAICEAGGHNVLGDIAGHICGRTIHLSGVLAGEGSPAMSGQSAVGINQNLAPGESGVPHWATDNESPGGIYEIPGAAIQKRAGDHRLYHFFDDIFSDQPGGSGIVVLSGDNYSINPSR